MRDDRGNVDAGVEQHAHLVPRLVHLPAVDAFDREHVEDDCLRIYRERLRRNAEKGYATAMVHIGDHLGECRGNARHFEPDVEALLHAELLLNVFKILFLYVDRDRNISEFFSKFEPIWIDVRDHDVASPGVAGDGGRHYTDRAGAGNEDVFAKDLKSKGSMH